MADREQLRDYSNSRAVLIATWEYTFLPPVPAVENSLNRMVRLLTGPLCGWPAGQLEIMGNEASPGELPDRLVTAFEHVTDVALFYYAGHGQADREDQLCLGLVGSRPEPSRRATTSLSYEAVRRALVESKARTKIVILDCCYAGLANQIGSTLTAATDDLLDRTGGSGAYTMAASGPDRTAWFEADLGVRRPQTYFTKYLADVIEHGIPGAPPELKLQPLFANVRDRLARDERPVPSDRNVDAARDFIFAYNAAPPETHVDPAIEIRKLQLLLDESERQRARERAAARELEQRLTAQMEKLALEKERLRDQALQVPSTAPVEQEALNYAIDEAESLLGEAAAAQEDAARRADAGEEAPSKRQFPARGIRFSVPRSAALDGIWTSHDRALTAGGLTIVFLFLNIFGVVSSVNPRRGVTSAEMATTAYVLAAVSVLSFARTSRLLWHEQYSWKAQAVTAGAIAGAALVHPLLPGWLGWTAFSVLLLVAVGGSMAGVPSRRSHATSIYLTGGGIDFSFKSGAPEHLPWTDTRDLLVQDNALFAHLTRVLPYADHLGTLASDRRKQLYRLFSVDQFGNREPVVKAVEFYRGSLADPYDPARRDAIGAGRGASNASEPAFASKAPRPARHLRMPRPNSSGASPYRRAELAVSRIWMGSAVRTALVAAALAGGIFTAVYFSGLFSLLSGLYASDRWYAFIPLALTTFSVMVVVIVAAELTGGLEVVLSEADDEPQTSKQRASAPSSARKADLGIWLPSRLQAALIAAFAALGSCLIVLASKLLGPVLLHSKLVGPSAGRVALTICVIALAALVAVGAGTINNQAVRLWLLLREKSDSALRSKRSQTNARSAELRLEWVSLPQIAVHAGLAGLLGGTLYLACFFSGWLRSIESWTSKARVHEVDLVWLSAAAFVVVAAMMVLTSNLLLGRGKFRIRLVEAD